jgi:hypothetical protein
MGHNGLTPNVRRDFIPYPLQQTQRRFKELIKSHVVECDGSAYDKTHRYNVAATAGYSSRTASRTLRITNGDVLGHQTFPVRKILDA